MEPLFPNERHVGRVAARIRFFELKQIEQELRMPAPLASGADEAAVLIDLNGAGTLGGIGEL